MNKKTSTLLGTVILVIIAITAFTFVYFSQKSSDEQSNHQTMMNKSSANQEKFKEKEIIEALNAPAVDKKKQEEVIIDKKEIVESINAPAETVPSSEEKKKMEQELMKQLAVPTK